MQLAGSPNLSLLTLLRGIRLLVVPVVQQHDLVPVERAEHTQENALVIPVLPAQLDSRILENCVK